ncbi:MAG: hypothetical protein WCC04_03460 [Terriglobales bacterium]
MILKITIAVAIGMLVLLFIPSVIATCMLLIKGIGDLGEKRQRRTVYYRR